MTERIKEIIFQGNHAWNLMYFGEFIEKKNYQITYTNTADRLYYNCAHIYDKLNLPELNEIEHFFEKKQISSRIYTHKFTDNILIEKLRALGYHHLTEEDEIWYEYSLSKLPDQLMNQDNKLLIEKIDPKTQLLDDFMMLNQKQNEMSQLQLDKCIAKIPNHHSNYNNEYYSAYINDTLATIGTLACFNKKAYLSEGATNPDYQRMGFYSMLVAFRLYISKMRGCEYAYIRCDKEAFSNNACMKLGFKKIFVRNLWEKIS